MFELLEYLNRLYIEYRHNGNIIPSDSSCSPETYLSLPNCQKTSITSHKSIISQKSASTLLSPYYSCNTSPNHLEKYRSSLDEKSILHLVDNLSIAEDKLVDFDPEMMYAVCIASKKLTKQKTHKKKSKFFSKFFRWGKRKQMRKRKDHISKTMADKETRNLKTSSEFLFNEIEYDLICNCPLVWKKITNGRRYSVSERHIDDRLLVLNACRKYCQIQNLNHVF